MTVTLCIPPRDGELCATIRFLLRADSTVMELTARHRITEVAWDPEEKAVAILIDITNPETSRPVDVRLDILPEDAQPPLGRTRFIGSVDRNREKLGVFGTYLGVVADEN